jgi:hypothetical protein
LNINAHELVMGEKAPNRFPDPRMLFGSLYLREWHRSPMHTLPFRFHREAHQKLIEESLMHYHLAGEAPFSSVNYH